VQTVPTCQNLYKNSFTYFVLQDDKSLRFDDAIGFIGNFLFALPSNNSALVVRTTIMDSGTM
jgi:hypothetical protein